MNLWRICRKSKCKFLLPFLTPQFATANIKQTIWISALGVHTNCELFGRRNCFIAIYFFATTTQIEFLFDFVLTLSPQISCILNRWATSSCSNMHQQLGNSLLNRVPCWMVRKMDSFGAIKVLSGNYVFGIKPHGWKFYYGLD